MDLLVASKKYIRQMIQNAGTGMKVLLMDQETVGIVSVVYSQSEILHEEVFLFERIDNKTKREAMRHLKCVVFVRPTRESIENLSAELRSPRYGQYCLYFSNVVSKADLKHLAESDDQEVVKEVQEFYADYFCVGPSFFTLNIPACFAATGAEWRQDALTRSLQGIAGVLLALKISPVIRYQGASPLAKKLAEKVKQFLTKEATLFDFRRPEIPPVLLIVDRRDDPITPMLNQWTYQAMLHELLTIRNQRVNLSAVPNIPRELQEVVLAPEQDEFFKLNMYQNYGEIATNIKRVIDDYQTQSKAQTKVETIADMKAFITNYPQFKKKSASVSKHVALISELSRLMNERQLLPVSELEQDMVAGNVQQTECLARLRQCLENNRVTTLDKLRLVLIYKLCFEPQAQPPAGSVMLQLAAALRKNPDLPSRWGDMPKWVGTFCTPLVRNVDAPFGGTASHALASTASSSAKGLFRALSKSVKGVENVYTQHEPCLKQTLENLLRNKLNTGSYPYVQPQSQQSFVRDRPQNVIVFIVGGMTYEEIAMVSKLNDTMPSVRIILGGTTIHNFASWLDEIGAATQPTAGQLPLTSSSMGLSATSGVVATES